MRSIVDSLSVYMVWLRSTKKGRLFDRSFPCLVAHATISKKNWSSNLEKIEEANVETNMKMALDVLENTVFESDESIISLDVKNLYPNVPLNEAIEIALKRLQTSYAARFDTQDYEKTVEYDSN